MEHKQITILDAEVAEKRKVQIFYIKVLCLKCQKTFGISPDGNTFDESKLVCFRCAAEELEQLKSGK